MTEFLKTIMPNVMNQLPELLKSCGETLYMTGAAGIISFVIGIFFAFVSTVTKRGGILQNLILWTTLDKIINFFRSVPFIILIVLLIPVTQIISGTAIGVNGAIVPLIFATAPFFSRQLENALAEIDDGSIEAAQAMGVSPIGIIFRVYLKESVPGIIRAVTVTIINLIGLTAMAGAVGGGGLGDLAIRYGYQRYQTDVTVITVIILIAMVSAIQSLGNFLARITTH
jgi:D-methionine transport system permease protein